MGRIASVVPDGVAFFKSSEPPHDRQRARGLKRNGILRRMFMKRTRIKRESKGHKAEMAKYNASAKAFFAEEGNDVCHICLRLREDGDNILLRKATERHHVRGRIGRLLNWRPGQLPSCRFHRTWPHDHPARARRLGLLCEAQDWNTFPG